MKKNKSQRVLTAFTPDLTLGSKTHDGKSNGLDALFMQNRKKEPKHIKDTYAATFCSAKNIFYQGMRRPFLPRATITDLLKTSGDLPYQLMTLCLSDNNNNIIPKLRELDELSPADQETRYKALAAENAARFDANFVQAFKKLGKSPNFFDLSNAAYLSSHAFLSFFLSPHFYYKVIDSRTPYLSHDITISSEFQLTFSSRFNPRLAKICDTESGRIIDPGKFKSLFDGEIEVIYKMDLTKEEQPGAVLHEIIFAQDSSKEFIAAFEMLFYGHNLFEIPKIVDDEENPLENKRFLAKIKLLKNFIEAKQEIAKVNNIHRHKLDLADPKICQSIKSRVATLNLGFSLVLITKKDASTSTSQISVVEADAVSIHSLDDGLIEATQKMPADIFDLGSSTITVDSLAMSVASVVSIESPESLTHFNSEATQNIASSPSLLEVHTSNSLQTEAPIPRAVAAAEDLGIFAQLANKELAKEKFSPASSHLTSLVVSLYDSRRSSSSHSQNDDNCNERETDRANSETVVASTPPDKEKKFSPASTSEKAAVPSSPGSHLLYDPDRRNSLSSRSQNKDASPLPHEATSNNSEAEFIRLAKEAATQYLEMFKWEPGNRRKVIWKKINPIRHHGRYGRERAQKISDTQESGVILGVIKESLVSGNKDEQSLNGYLVENLRTLNSNMEKKNIKDDLGALIAFIEKQVLPLEATPESTVGPSNS